MTQVQMPKFACSHISSDRSVKRMLVTAHLYCIIHPASCSVVREVCRYNTFNIYFIYIYMVSNCCLSLYLNITGIRQGPGKMLLGSWKVLGKSLKFFNQDSGNPGVITKTYV